MTRQDEAEMFFKKMSILLQIRIEKIPEWIVIYYSNNLIRLGYKLLSSLYDKPPINYVFKINNTKLDYTDYLVKIDLQNDK